MLSYHINAQHNEPDSLHIFVVNELPYGDTEVVMSLWMSISDFTKLVDEAAAHVEKIASANRQAADLTKRF